MKLRVLVMIALNLATFAHCLTAATPKEAGRPATQPATDESAAAAGGAKSLFFDPEDGAFDISGFLSTRTGFLPVVMPVTEPAVGYGLGGGITFFHEKPRVVQTDAGPRVIPPNATVVGGMATENGSWAGGAGHLHNWNDGRIRYVIGGGYGSLNLDWFGQGDAFAGRAFSYNIEAYALMQKLTFKLGDSDFFFGPTQRLLITNTEFDFASDLPTPGFDLGIFPDQFDSTISGLGLTLGYDTRNSLFSPTRGTKGSLSWTQNDEAIGSDFDYGRLDAEVCQYVPLGGPFTLGLRAEASFAGDNAPFFDLASINLRGIQRGRYVDNTALTLEAELRWDIAPRWTLLGFGGVGWAADKFDEIDDAEDEWAGGAGFRYLIARKYDLRMGCDVARGPEDWAFYVTVGTGWLRD
ncbi:MAG: BamA/TamA family outer membrane protein [Tepidisphaeraceae bacterium]